MSARRENASRVMSAAEAGRSARSWRERGERLAIAEGSFDVLDVRHARALAALRAGLDRLVVGVRDDASASAHLGRGRPVQAAAERARLVAALRGVDVVVIGDESTLAALVGELRPDRRGDETTLDADADRVARVRARRGSA